MKSYVQLRAKGFTLVEILMAMAIFGLVLAAIYATWTLIIKSSKLGVAAAAQVQRERMAIRTIEEALMATRSFEADQQHYGFVAENGESASLSFVARLPKSYPRGGKFGDFDVRRVTFSIQSGAEYGQRELVVRQNPILMDLDDDEKDHPLVLARGVKEMALEFWDMRKSDWVEEWTQTNQLPKLVKVTLRFTRPAQHGYGYAQTEEEIARVVALPSIMVPRAWQTPGIPGAGGQPPPPPGGGIQPPGGVPPPPPGTIQKLR